MCAIMYAPHRPKGEKAKPPDDFNPYAKKARRDVIYVNDKASLARMRKAFTGKGDVKLSRK